MNKFKKIAASVIAAATVCAVGIDASAAVTNRFAFIIDSESGNWSQGEVKRTDSKSVKITTDSGSVSAVKPVYGTVYSRQINSNSYRVSNSRKITNNNKTYYASYTDSSVEKGNTYYLRCDTGAYETSISGYWYP